MTDLLSNIREGKYDRKKLETLLKNAARKGGHEDIVDACNIALASLRKRPPTGGGRQPTGQIAEQRDGYVIMASALDNRELRKPGLVPVALELCEHPLVENVAIMKTQIRLYLKGRHMVSGLTSEGGYWFGILDESKIADSTVSQWEGIGKIDRGQYFDTNYINVRFEDISDIRRAIDMVSFT